MGDVRGSRIDRPAFYQLSNWLGNKYRHAYSFCTIAAYSYPVNSCSTIDGADLQSVDAFGLTPWPFYDKGNYYDCFYCNYDSNWSCKTAVCTRSSKA